MFTTLRSITHHSCTQICAIFQATVALGVIATGLAAGEAPGIAHAFDRDSGLAGHAAVRFFDDFESGSSVLVPTNSGRTIVTLASPLGGTRVMATHNRAGTHDPYDTYAPIVPTDTIYYRFYSRFEPGYAMGGGVKGPGVAAKKAAGPPAGGAGIKPQGDDKFSARLSFDSQGRPYLYYYHMDMGEWGSNANQNVGTPVSMQPGTWYCIEMMLAANTPGQANGELRMWIDGVLKVQQGGIRFRTTTELKINWIDHSAYFGGSWVSPQDQSRFEDNIVAATSYIGPFGTGSGGAGPTAPTDLSATAISAARIDLTWVDASADETGFAIERKSGAGGTWSQIATTAANTVAYSNTGLMASRTYVYRVRAVRSGSYSAYSNESTATTLNPAVAPPAAPNSLTVTAVSASRIDLSWIDASNNESGFVIERKAGADGTWTQIATRSANTTTYSNTGLAAETTYSYRIRATNAGGHSAFSNEVSASTTAQVNGEGAPRSQNNSCGFGSALSLLVLGSGLLSPLALVRRLD